VSLVVTDRSLGLLGVARTQAGFGVGKGKARDESIDLADDTERAEEVGECVRGDLTGEGWRRNVYVSAVSYARSGGQLRLVSCTRKSSR
jgi:hypothetical protein